MTFGIVTMLIGVPKEIKDSEYRVGLVPSTVRELTRNGHHVIVERSAGLGAGSPLTAPPQRATRSSTTAASART